MDLSLVNFRTELREHLGVDTNDPKFTTTVLNDLLNRSYWEIQDKFPFREKQTSVTFPSVAGERQYQIPGDVDALSQISVLNPDDTTHKKLARIDKSEYEDEYNEDINARAMPTNYFREESTIYLYPTPDDVYTFTLKYDKTLADLVNDADAPTIPNIWWEIILYGATWRGYIRRGDMPRKDEFRAIQINLINSTEPKESKEEGDSQEARLFAQRPSYGV
jgi:hypothetical protein